MFHDVTSNEGFCTYKKPNCNQWQQDYPNLIESFNRASEVF